MTEKQTKLHQLQFQLDIIQRKINELNPLILELAMDQDIDKLIDPEEYKKRKRKERNRRFYQNNKDKHWNKD